MITVLNTVTAILQGIKTGFVWFLFASPVIAAFVVVLIKKKYKNTIVLRQKTKGDTDKVLITSFTIKKPKAEAEYIKTWSKRLDLPIPPEEAIDIKSNGAWFVEGYVTEGGEITYIEVDAKRIEGDKNNKVKDPKITKLSTQDKSFYFNRLRKAQDKYAIGGFWDFISRNAGVIGLVMVIFVLFLFWADIMQPAIEMKDADLQRIKIEESIVKRLDVLIRDRQLIQDAPTFNTSGPPDAPE